MSSTSYCVLLFLERGLDLKHAEQTAAWFERFPGPITIQVVQPTVVLQPNESGELTWDSIFRVVSKLREDRAVPLSTFIYLLTKTPNEMNWYAAEDSKQMRNGFGHLGDFNWVTSAPESVISAHFLLKALFNALLDEAKVPWQDMWHEEPRGCFFDFCRNKWELNLKLRTADICGDCMEILGLATLPDELLAQTTAIMEGSRRLAINTGQFLKKESGFSEWPFPVAVTRHKAVQASNPLLKFMLLLDHFDSLIRYFYLAHEIEAGRKPENMEEPSLGWWVDQLARSLKGEKHFRDVVRIAAQEKVVTLRNEKRGHGWMSATDEAYRDDVEKLENILARIEEELRPFLDKYQLLIPRAIRLRDGIYVVEGERLQGSHLLHPTFKLELKDPGSVGLTSQDEVFLTDSRMQSFKRISPYIVSANCPECRHQRVLITDGGQVFIDVFVGHRVKLKNYQ